MDPNQQPVQYNAPPPNQPVDPLAGYDGTAPQASAVPPITSFNSPRPKRSRLPFIIGGGVAGLLIIVSLAVVLTAKKPPSNIKPKANTSDTNGSSFLRPANAIAVEQTANSISQDLSGLNDDIDFPPNKIDDKALGL